jgi:hypothetical protein
MQSEGDVWNATFYYRAIRKGLGDAFAADYDLSQPLPHAIRTLLIQLDEPSVQEGLAAETNSTR